MKKAIKDYAKSGLDIQHAMMEAVSASKNRLFSIRWNRRQISTADCIKVPENGYVRLEFLSSKGSTDQGADIKVDGWLKLSDGRKVKLLRTWNDPKFEPVVEYPFRSKNRELWVWNVYKKRIAKTVFDEKWTGNAGFWIERLSNTERVYHCSHGMADPPDFESLVFKIRIGRPKAKITKAQRAEI